VFFSELVVPAAGGVLHWVGKKEWAQAQQNPKNGWQGGGVLVAFLTMELVSAVEAVEAPVRWRPLRSSELDKMQPERMSFLFPD
jgi:hypothetical protein